MSGALKGVTEAIQAAGQNPLALVALLLILAAWVIIALKVSRHRTLLKHLQSVPEKDRLKVLQAEIGVVPPKGQLAPELWVRHKVHTYYFYLGAGLILGVLVIAAFVFSSRPDAWKSGLSISMHDPSSDASKPETGEDARKAPAADDRREELVAAIPVTVEPRIVMGERMMAEDNTPPLRTVSYEAVVENNVTHVRYSLPYLDRLRRGGPLEGVNSLATSFVWRYPELSFKVVNNTHSNLVLSRAQFRLTNSRVVESAIPVFEDLTVNKLIVRNEGWGLVIDPVYEFTISKPLGEGEVSAFAPELHRMKRKTFDSEDSVDIVPFTPAPLRSESFVVVAGSLSFGLADARQKVRFATRVSLQVRAGAGIPVSHTYQLMFKAGEAPVTREIEIAEQIPRGEAGRFVVRLATDKTSTTDMRIRVGTAGGEWLNGGEFRLDIFVARSHGELKLVRR